MSSGARGLGICERGVVGSVAYGLLRGRVSLERVALLGVALGGTLRVVSVVSRSLVSLWSSIPFSKDWRGLESGVDLPLLRHVRTRVSGIAGSKKGVG